jgi:hypothetical protein
MPSLIARARPGALVAVCALALFLAACAGGAVHTPPTATSAPHANLVHVANTQSVADGGISVTATGTCPSGDPAINGDCGVTVSAACPRGAPLLSGGYALQADAGYVVSSYPSSSNTWTVTAHNEGNDGTGGPVTLTTYANCMQANFPVTSRIVPATPSVPADGDAHTFSVSCPAGTTLTGGGFQGSNGNSLSMPSGSSWTAQLSVQDGSAAAPHLFAICATGKLAAGATPSVNAPITPTTPADVAVGCPAGQLLVGGGYSEGDYFGGASTSAATADFSQWHVQASIQGATGPGTTITETGYAVCVTVGP